MDKEKDIFQNESNIVEETKKTILSIDTMSTNEITSKFKNLASEYNKLFKLCKKISKISDAQGKQLRKSQLETKNILDNSNQGFLTINQDYLIGKSFSLECEEILGKNIVGSNFFEIIDLKDKEIYRVMSEQFLNIFEENSQIVIEQLISKLPCQLIINNKYIDMVYKVIYEINKPNNEKLIMMILTNVTDKKKAKEKIEYINTHDKLTGLYNRTYLNQLISELEYKTNIGIIFGDVNGLKLTNDVFGHQKGDELLLLISNILKECCWKDEIVIRWGGDEFIILVTDASIEVCDILRKRIKNACSVAKWDPIGPSISLGIAVLENEKFDFHKLFNLSEKNMYADKLLESLRVKKHLISNIEKVLIEKCYESKEHMENIENILLKFAAKVGNLKTPAEIEQAKLAVRLHDAGKVTIATEILKKNEELTPDDWVIVKAHSETGFRMLQSIEEHTVANIVLYIHERWDGEGYPHGLAKEEIPLLSRMISIVETFDRLTNFRTYKNQVEKKLALEEIKNNSGTQFDPTLVKIFIEEFT